MSAGLQQQNATDHRIKSK